MPPRYAYWTILIDNAPTAFRAADRDDLLPTFAQLQRTNPNIVMKWFARGRLWDSPEEARAESLKPRFTEKRGQEWRPGGQHKDPRARWDRKKTDHRPRRDNDRSPGAQGFSPVRPKPVAQDVPGPPRPRDSGRPDVARDFKKPHMGQGFSPARPQPGGQRPFQPGGAKPFRPRGPGGSRPFGSGGGFGPPKSRSGQGGRPFGSGGGLGPPKSRSGEGGRPPGSGGKPFRPSGGRPSRPGPPRDRRK